MKQGLEICEKVSVPFTSVVVNKPPSPKMPTKEELEAKKRALEKQAFEWRLAHNFFKRVGASFSRVNKLLQIKAEAKQVR